MADSVGASHILLMYAGSSRSTATRSKDDALKEIQGYKQMMDDGIEFEALARANSDCPSGKDGGALGPCILAGPSCDSADVMYEKRPVMLPLNLVAGDRVLIRNTGAYTTTYSSVGFNGFPPLAVCVI